MQEEKGEGDLVHAALQGWVDRDVMTNLAGRGLD